MPYLIKNAPKLRHFCQMLQTHEIRSKTFGCICILGLKHVCMHVWRHLHVFFSCAINKKLPTVSLYANHMERPQLPSDGWFSSLAGPFETSKYFCVTPVNFERCLCIFLFGHSPLLLPWKAAKKMFGKVFTEWKCCLTEFWVRFQFFLMICMEIVSDSGVIMG